jgi:hypothetical protein
LKDEAQNRTRPVRYRVRSPPQFFGKCSLYSAGAAMNFIVKIKFQKKSPVAAASGVQEGNLHLTTYQWPSSVEVQVYDRVFTPV